MGTVGSSMKKPKEVSFFRYGNRGGDTEDRRGSVAEFATGPVDDLANNILGRRCNGGDRTGSDAHSVGPRRSKEQSKITCEQCRKSNGDRGIIKLAGAQGVGSNFLNRRRKRNYRKCASKCCDLNSATSGGRDRRGVHIVKTVGKDARQKVRFKEGMKTDPHFAFTSFPSEGGMIYFLDPVHSKFRGFRGGRPTCKTQQIRRRPLKDHWNIAERGTETQALTRSGAAADTETQRRNGRVVDQPTSGQVDSEKKSASRTRRHGILKKGHMRNREECSSKGQRKQVHLDLRGLENMTMREKKRNVAGTSTSKSFKANMHETVETYIVNFCKPDSNYIQQYSGNGNHANEASRFRGAPANEYCLSNELDAYVDVYLGALEPIVPVDAATDFDAIHKAAKEGHADLIQQLLTRGVHVNCATRIRRLTPLHIAASSGHLGCVRLLLQNEADVNCLSDNGETPLWCASICNHLAVVKLLVLSGARVNMSAQANYDSPLHTACMMGHYDVAKFLVTHGADINCKDENKLEPIYYAAFEGHRGIVKLMVREHVKQSLQRMVQSLVLRMKANSSYTPGTEMDYYLRCKSILKRRISSRILCCAIISGNSRTVDVILRGGANQNCFDVRLQLFPLHAASITGNFKIFKKLIDRGANIFMRTLCNNAPYDLTDDQEIKNYILFLSRKINTRNAFLIRRRNKGHIIAKISNDVFYHLCSFF